MKGLSNDLSYVTYSPTRYALRNPLPAFRRVSDLYYNSLATPCGGNKNHTRLYTTQQGGLSKYFGTAMYATCKEKYSRVIVKFIFPSSRFLTVTIIPTTFLSLHKK